MTMIRILLVLVLSNQGAQSHDASANSKSHSDTPQTTGRSMTLEDRLLTRARTLYGGSGPSRVRFGHPPTGAVATPQGETKSAPSPFDGSGEEGIQLECMKGDVASGVILLEEKDALYLDISPCHPEARVLTFHVPYNKKRVGSVSCGKNASVDKFMISQR